MVVEEICLLTSMLSKDRLKYKLRVRAHIPLASEK